jgi:hypothetical protein
VSHSPCSPSPYWASKSRANELDPRAAVAYFGRANVRLDLVDLAGAIDDFSRAVAITPGFAEAYNGRGVAL